MKLKVFATGLTLTAATLMGTIAAQAHDVEYRGEARAAAICQAVAEDKPHEVKLELRKAARDQRGTTVAQVSQESFRCNGKDLKAFAEEAGAGKALAFLERGETRNVVAQN